MAPQENAADGLQPDAPIAITGRVVVAGGPPARRRYGTSLRRLANGDLLACYHESAGPDNLNDGAAVIARSRDGGRTWDHPITLYAEPGWHCGPVSGVKVLPDGTVLAVVGKMQRSVSNATTYGLEMSRTATFVTRSTDHGRTWGELESIDGFWPFFTEMYGPADPLVLGDGRLLFCIQGTREVNGHGWEAAVTTTADGGRTFTTPVLIATSPTIDFNDTALARLDDGRILAVIRTEQPPYHAYQSSSADDGATWSEPRPAGFLGGTPCLYRLRSGALVCFYRDREPDRPGVSCVVTTDGGATWQWVGQIYRSPDWFCGYPAVAQLSAETFLCVYFTAIVDGNSEVQGVFLEDRS
jgi:BNR repeat-like domain